MSFRSLFSAKDKSKEKKDKSKSKPLLSAQESYDLGGEYLQKFLHISGSTDSLDQFSKAVVGFFRDLHADEKAGNYRLAIRNKFVSVQCAENIDFLYNYFEMDSNLTKEQWGAFYHQYIEEDKTNKKIEFTEINIDEGERALFSQLDAKIKNNELDLDKIMLDSKSIIALPPELSKKKSCSGSVFLDFMAVKLAGYFFGKEELISSAIKEQQQKASAAGALSVTKEPIEKKNISGGMKPSS